MHTPITLPHSRQFGSKTISVNPVLKSIPIIFSHADKGVRAEVSCRALTLFLITFKCQASQGTLLVQELHRWLGPALDPHLSELKPVQVKELNETFINEEKGLQTRFTRSQQRDKAIKEAEASLVGIDASKSAQADEDKEASRQDDEKQSEPNAYDSAEPVVVLDHLPSDFFDMLNSSKWKERKEMALDPLLEILKRSTRLVSSNYEELVRALAGRMTDANIACVIAAATCIERLALGLRAEFSRYKQMVMPPILERCKEKKQSVTDALSAALDATFSSVHHDTLVQLISTNAVAQITISDIVEDIVAFSKHKNPQVKEQTYKFLTRSLKRTTLAPAIKTDLKPLADCLVLGFEDSFEPVRTAAAEGLGTLLKVMGERPLNATMDSLDDIRKAKVKEFAEKAEVKIKAGIASKPALVLTARPAAPAMRPPAGKPVSSNYADLIASCLLMCKSAAEASVVVLFYR